jgi:hypothetical protein
MYPPHIIDIFIHLHRFFNKELGLGIFYHHCLHNDTRPFLPPSMHERRGIDCARTIHPLLFNSRNCGLLIPPQSYPTFPPISVQIVRSVNHPHFRPGLPIPSRFDAYLAPNYTSITLQQPNHLLTACTACFSTPSGLHRGEVRWPRLRCVFVTWKDEAEVCRGVPRVWVCDGPRGMTAVCRERGGRKQVRPLGHK